MLRLPLEKELRLIRFDQLLWRGSFNDHAQQYATNVNLRSGVTHEHNYSTNSICYDRNRGWTVREQQQYANTEGLRSNVAMGMWVSALTLEFTHENNYNSNPICLRLVQRLDSAE
jgi:hypothetical protein